MPLGSILPVHPTHPMESLEDAPGGAQPRPEGRSHGGERCLHEWLGLSDEPGQHSHAIAQQATIGRMMDRGLHTG
ncbi:MAG: hypothetical protein ACRETH_14605, partial [Steroidobacteraceae bacterium]